MIKGKILTLLFLVSFLFSGFSQEDATELEAPAPPSGVVFKPTIGLGVGMFTYYGDISKGTKTNHPVVSRVGYDLRVTQPITNHLDVNFYVLFGKLGANERSADRNLNFESTVRMGGFALSYNFHHVLPEDRVIDPYISLGIESFEFLSKTDLRDQHGNEYHYWDDGSIRNIAQADPDADQAIRITRDYVYESDIRELDVDGFGKYPERSFAIPVGVGANLHVSERVKFRIGTAMHFSFSDYVDGVTDESVGNRAGDAANDKFLFTSFNLNYQIGRDGADELLEDYSDVDFLAIDMGDEDGDGIIDFDDESPQTPSEAIVNDKGVPEDSDGDNVPDYLDEEPDTPDSLFANMEGIGLTDEMIEEMHKRYADSTCAYCETALVNASHDSERKAKKGKKQYMVQVGDRTDLISKDLVNSILSMPGVKTVQQGDSTIFVAGTYDDLPSAVRAALEIEGQGGPGASIVETNDEGNVVPVDEAEVVETAETVNNTGPEKELSSDLIYRIQLGAFSKPLSNDVFDGVGKVVNVQGDDGLIRYYAGSYPTYQEAATARVDLIADGFNDAFVVSLKGGQKVKLSSTGEATPANKSSNVDEQVRTEASGSGKGAKFRVQLGAYTNEIPTNILERFMVLGDVEHRKGDDGLSKYVVGSFDSYEDALKYKDEMASGEFQEAFVVGEFNGKIISSEEAKELK